MWKLRIVDDQDQKTVVNLVRDEYRIGRAPGNPIRLTERNVSRHHATIQRTPTGYRIEDHHSYNGVFVNGVRVVGRQDLGHRDVIQLGDYRIQVMDEALETQEQGFSPYPGGAVMPASGRLPHRLVVLIGPEQGSTFALEGDRFLIGRGEECEFVVDHASVSRVHAEIRRIDADHFELIDKGSANGVRVNGHDRPRAVLDGRDVIELGDVALKYIAQGQVFHADSSEGQRIVALSGSPPPAPEGRSRLSAGAMLAAALGGAALVALLLFVVLLPRERAKARVAPPSDLVAATQHFEAGRLDAAHELLKRIPEGSQDRATEPFRAIEAAWAESSIRSAEAEADPAKKREILDAVSKTKSVPDELRRRAIDVMNAEASQAVGLDEIEGTKAGGSTTATAGPSRANP